MNRTQASLKNFIWTNVSTFANMLLNFVLRTALAKTLGAEYIGINGLFTNVLGMLSLAELGLGAAIGFSLYKPLAKGDKEKIQALINFYRTAYRMVAFVVFVIGAALIPFLPKIAKGSDGIEHLTFIYCIYIFNTVTSYLITYKTTVISADQKNYLITNINTAFNFVIGVFQILTLVLFKNYVAYLLVASVIGLIKNICFNIYTNKKYPYLKGKNSSRLTGADKSVIFSKIRAMMYHKIGEVAVFQTDSIITSSIINVTTVGLVANYTMVINVVKSVANSLFNAMIPSMGNLIVSGNTKRVKTVYDRMEFICFWVSCFTTVCLYFLLTPFVEIWLGKEYELSRFVVFLLCANHYAALMRTPSYTARTAAGAFDKDKLSPLFESAVNLIISVVLAKIMGVAGVYIGTFVSGIVPGIWRPVIVYKYVLKSSSREYFVSHIKKTLVLAFSILSLSMLFEFVEIENKYLSFLFTAACCVAVPNAALVISYCKTDEFKYLKGMLKKLLIKIKAR